MHFLITTSYERFFYYKITLYTASQGNVAQKKVDAMRVATYSLQGLAVAKTYRPEVNSSPLTPPNVESETNTGTIQDMIPNALSPNSYKPTTVQH